MEKLQFEFKKAFYKRKLGSAEHREFELLQNALDLMKSGGLANISFTALAQKSKVSRPAVHHYFKQKSDLIERLLDFTTLDLRLFVQARMGAQTDSTISSFESYCRATLDWPAERPASAFALLTIVQTSATDADVRKRNEHLSAVGKQTIQALLSQDSAFASSLYKVAAIQSLLTGGCLNLLIEKLSQAESKSLRNSCVRGCLDIAKLTA